MGYPGPENLPKDEAKKAPKGPPKRAEGSEVPKETWQETLRRGIRSIPEMGLVYGAGTSMILTVIALMSVPVWGYSHDEATGFIKSLHDNWRAFVILSAPLLYGPVKKFVDEAEEAFGVKRTRQPLSTEDKAVQVGKVREQRQRAEE